MKGIIDFSKYIGKEFLYISKYGGETIGIVENIYHNSFTAESKNGVYYQKPHSITVRSTNNIPYDFEELWFKL